MIYPFHFCSISMIKNLLPIPIPDLNSSSLLYILRRSEPAVDLPPLAVLGFVQAAGNVELSDIAERVFFYAVPSRYGYYDILELRYSLSFRSYSHFLTL